MNRLQSELQRLYAADAAAAHGSADTSADAPGLVDAAGRVRAMVLELARPADWAALSKVWQGVQADLELPAPAIAVSGKDGCQLWFSLAQPVPAAQAMAFLEALRRRYLGEVRPDRVGAMPALDAGPPSQTRHAEPVPALQAGTDHWSAFIAPDLAPVFADEPWLDTPPSLEGQAELLSRLRSIGPGDFLRALEASEGQQALASAAGSGRAAAGSAPAAPAGPVAAEPSHGRAATVGPWLDPRRFLLDVMNNAAEPLALRIEAAKALLPYFSGPCSD